MSKNNEVQIVNPAHGRGFTSRKKAENYVSRGRARWRGAAIEFIDADYSSLSVHASIAHTRRHFIDGGIATLDQIRGLPVAGDAVRLIMGRRVTA